MIEFIDMKLRLWGEWKVKNEAGVRGRLESSLAMWQGVSISASTDWLSYVPIGDLEACELDAIVASLNDELKVLAIEVYYYSNTFSDKLKNLGCSERTFYYRLHKLHETVKDELLERS